MGKSQASIPTTACIFKTAAPRQCLTPALTSVTAGLLGCSRLHHDSPPTRVTFISSALITSFLCNQIATRLGELSHSFIPFQSVPHWTGNCPLIQSTASLAVLVHLLPGVPAKFLIWRLAIRLHRKISNVPHDLATDCRDCIERTPLRSILAAAEISKFSSTHLLVNSLPNK